MASLDNVSLLIVASEPVYREMEPHWNRAMITASIAISFLGAFTSTQLMCHARMSIRFSSTLVWATFSSIIFGFCSIWSLHMVATLACELDLPIGLDAPLTVLSSVLAVGFTFAALSTDLLWHRYYHGKRGKGSRAKRPGSKKLSDFQLSATKSSLQSLEAPLLQINGVEDDEENDAGSSDQSLEERQAAPGTPCGERGRELNIFDDVLSPGEENPLPPNMVKLRDPAPSPVIRPPLLTMPSTESADLGLAQSESHTRTSSEWSVPRRDSSAVNSSSESHVSSSFGLSSAMGIVYRKGTSSGLNVFHATATVLWNGLTVRNIVKGGLWSLAITSMHYVGIAAMRIPEGYLSLNSGVVAASAMISWAVCLVGCILMAEMETQLSQQLLFSVVATLGVAAMHFTGMRAATFWSTAPPAELRGYPPALAMSVIAIAFTTCIAANGLLAHSATLSRNKLAEIIWTRRELWRTIAQKENAEAAALARSDFIASASHEIRTPLHHLQGYSDLLSQTELTEEGRALLASIQRATKTLSLITNNVLDWSKLEKDAEAVWKPVALEIRAVCESIIVLLPNIDDEANVELYVVVAPDVPRILYLDESYTFRILMNLLSNALKFTRLGYILLTIQMKDEKLVATVSDTGCGLDASFIPHMWEPFKQGETRGSQRGTGLGLSIVKQLLSKIHGTITVESKALSDEDVRPEESGSTFTITIPASTTTSGSPPEPVRTSQKIAILTQDTGRSLEGLRTSWERFGFEVTVARDVISLPKEDWKYIWADLPFVKADTVQLKQLIKQDEHAEWKILVPCDSQSSTKGIPGLASNSRFVVLQKPLIWHSFEKRIAAANQQTRKGALSQTVRFAPTVEIMNGEKRQHGEEHAATAKQLVVLIVEDNPINQRLGKKMLAALGYQVLTADDGQDAIDKITMHDAVVDAILMDQSMPRKDGITATEEIRAMEASGALSRRRPIVAVTAVVNPQAQAMFKAAGADDFLAKPLALGKLKDTLALYLPMS